MQVDDLLLMAPDGQEAVPPPQPERRKSLQDALINLEQVEAVG
jgi:hypothetical protein